ncbi:ATP-dependent nuclease [Endozoicomonas acroporae]|uniref:ATP-dependent nuclease n=1 Tax=Endozoicomonas acroporae TaxID=1701104 RepID=UPI003D7A8A09
MDKAILVGPNEAGKTAVCMALQQINPPEGIDALNPLRDYPRSEYGAVNTGRVNVDAVPVVEAVFELDDADKMLIGDDFQGVTYRYFRYYEKGGRHRLDGGPKALTYADIEKDLKRLIAHTNKQYTADNPDTSEDSKPGQQILHAIEDSHTWISDTKAQELESLLDEVYEWVEEDNEKEEERHARLKLQLQQVAERENVLSMLRKRLPVFVLYSNYFRVRPILHLGNLATRLESGVMDDDTYDYGNTCLLKLLGFTARDLSDQANIPEPPRDSQDAWTNYREKKDKRAYQLNAASTDLTREIRKVWNPDPKRADADKLRIAADGQYLKVTVEDDLGVEIELDQRSEGFQWMVSFFVVFFAEAMDKHNNAILLLDEPGVSLHGHKQKDFRHTIARLAKENQVLYTTHSPFMVGPDELDLVRVVEMTDRNKGTKINNTVVADDPAALLPLQEALGYDLAQSLFTQKKNLVLEGLTDLWYIEGVSLLASEAGVASLDSKIALLPASSASKVTYFATILSAQEMKVAALLDSDAAGDLVAQQDNLQAMLGSKAILRVKDFYKGSVAKPEIEDLLRETLIKIAREDAALEWNIEGQDKQQAGRSIVGVFQSSSQDFSKYKLAKAFVRWAREHSFKDLLDNEQKHWKSLFAAANKALK